MAYCVKCGAYIPDGHIKCLACGYEKAAQTGSAYEYKEAKSNSTDFLKKQLEEQRKRQQENSRKWAETEKAQREKTRAQNSSYNTRTVNADRSNAVSTIDSSKIFSAMSYFGMLFVIPYIICKNDDYALFHAKQGMLLFLAALVAQAAASLLGFGWIVSIARLYFIYKGVSSALKGRKDKLPYIGGLL